MGEQRPAIEVAAFRRRLRECRYSERTIDLYCQYVLRCGTFVRATYGTSLSRASTEHLLAWWRKLPEGASTRRLARRSLVTFYKLSVEHRRNPAEDIPLVPEPYRFPRPISGDMLTRFLTAAHELGGRHEVLGVMFATTGCRFSELHRALWTQFDLSTPATWYIEGKGSGRRGPKIKPVPLHSESAGLLRRWRLACGSRDWVFPGERKSLVSPPVIRREFAEICETAGFDEHVVPHRLRHTFATVALLLMQETGGNIRVVQELMRHEDLASTQIYTDVTDEQKRALVEAMSA